MIIAALLLMQTSYSPETEAVMNRSRKQAAERRVEEGRAKAAQAQGPKDANGDAASFAQAVKLPAAVAARLQACLDKATDDPVAGVKFAQDWALEGGGFPAAQCNGFAEAQAENWDDAAKAFDAAATAAQKEGALHDAARLWTQAGNAMLAGGKPDKARDYFDAALGHGLPDGLAKGEVYLDRARTLVMLNDMAGARKDLDMALVQAKDDPLAWLLSATLARRQDDFTRARHDIEEAKKRAPDDASVALEDGNIAIVSGDEKAARMAWEQVLKLSPDGDASKFAKDALAQLDAQAQLGAQAKGAVQGGEAAAHSSSAPPSR
ncbi:MAG: tetratricopeptide repeat protein [Sphingobium sp.]|nr:tetratricopeptide repeat protein [Sphingobium sp.]